MDWTTGHGVEDSFRTKAGVIHDMSVNAVMVQNTHMDVLFVSESIKSSYKIVAYDPSDLASPISHIIHNDAGKVNLLRTANAGNTIVAAAASTIVVGVLKPRNLQSIEDLAYDFHSVDTNDDVCCLSIRNTPKKSTSKKKASEDTSDDIVDVAVGGARGAIFVYADLLTQLRGKSKKGLDVPRKQHWHRKAVHSIAWSKDGEPAFTCDRCSGDTNVIWQETT